MGRPGEFFDQDQPTGSETAPGGPSRAGFGMLYDQDRVDEPTGGRDDRLRRRESERQKELELRRQIHSRPGPGERREPPSQPAAWPEPPPPEIGAADHPLRISSRPAPMPPPPRPRGGQAATGVWGPPARREPPPATPRPPGPPKRRPRGSEPRSTGQTTAILAAGTFASRITGFLRVLAIAYVLGVGSLSDAFNYANGVPNIVYDLILGGILSATLIPVFVDQLEGTNRQDQTRSISAIVTAVGAALVGVSVLLWLLAPLIIHFYLVLNHSSTGPGERALATQLLRYFAPQVFFLGAIVVSTALLNARRSFTAAAFSPVVNNVIAIAALLITKVVAQDILTAKKASPSATLRAFQHDRRAVLILGLGTTAGYAVQLLVQWPAMRKAGYRLRLVWDLHHPAVRQVARLSTWLIGVVVANQASLALVMVLAGRTQGGVTAYQFAYQFFQLPYALIAVSVASALMPDLASLWTADDRTTFERQFAYGLRVTLAILIPIAGVYVAVAQPFIQLAIHHGRVAQSGAHLVSSSLALFAVGLPGFAAYFLLIRVYQAMQQGRAMFWLYVLENGLTLVAALILEPLLGVPGLALAWAAPYTIAAVVAAADLRRRVGTFGGIRTVRSIVRVTIASAVTVAVVAGVGVLFPSAARANDAVLVGRLLVQAGLGAAVYLALSRLMGIPEVQAVLRLGRRLAS